MNEKEHPLPPLPEEAFRRYDEAPDEEFYLLPRFVTHIDDHAIAAVTQLYREFFPPRTPLLLRTSVNRQMMSILEAANRACKVLS